MTYASIRHHCLPDVGPTRLLYGGCLPILLCGIALVLAGIHVCEAQERKLKDQPGALTQIELQSELMSFADRFMMIISQAAVEDVQEAAWASEPHLIVTRDAAFSAAAAFTIASEPNPEVALLDMVVVMTLGRMIYTEHWREKLGASVQPMVAGFRLGEQSIWRIAARVLTPAQQQELRQIIRMKRQQHPKQLRFSHLRFRDFASTRRASTLLPDGKSGGMFSSVKKASRSIDEVRLLVERAMFVAARLPLLSGAFARFWGSQLLTAPEVAQVLTDATSLSDTLHRLTSQMEQLPGHLREESRTAVSQIAKEAAQLRETTLDQTFKGVARERQHIMEDLRTEEARLQRLLVEMQQTLTLGNELSASVQTTMTMAKELVDRVSVGLPIANVQAVDMAALAESARQFTALTRALEQLLSSPGWEQQLPHLLQIVDRTEREGEDFVGYSVRQIFFYSVMLTLVILMAALVYRYVSLRLFNV